ncbi:MAG: AbrB/MazE/SpoVT family DNA-binding domain-containing protein [Verrucomicrobiota bacterium]
MKPLQLKVIRIGNSRGIRLPSRLLRKYRIRNTLLIEERASEIALKVKKEKTLSWKETFEQMATEKESWQEWEGVAGDGLDAL